jgi:hypothetical protein
VRERGQALLVEVKDRVTALATVVVAARHTRALAAWHAELQNQREALRAGCADRSRTPQLYIAWRDLKGQTHWKFCDGSEVTSASGAALVFDPSVRSFTRGQRRFGEKEYLAAVKAWPGAQVMTPPAAPAQR